MATKPITLTGREEPAHKAAFRLYDLDQDRASARSIAKQAGFYWSSRLSAFVSDDPLAAENLVTRLKVAGFDVELKGSWEE